MNFRVYAKERLLLGRLPRGGWRFSILYIYRLAEDCTEWVSVPMLENRAFVDRRGSACPANELPRIQAHRAIREAITQRFPQYPSEECAQTSTWDGDNVNLIDNSA